MDISLLIGIVIMIISILALGLLSAKDTDGVYYAVIVIVVITLSTVKVLIDDILLNSILYAIIAIMYGFTLYTEISEAE